MADWDVAATQPADQANPWDVVSHEAEPSFWRQAAGVAAQIPQGINESLGGFVNIPGNATAWLLKQAGLRDKDKPPPSETTKGALAPTFGITEPIDRIPAPGPEQWANSTGHAIGDVASTVVPFGLAGRVANSGVRLAPSAGREVAKTLAAKPAMQTALTAASNIAVDETKDQVPEWASPYYSLAIPFALGGALHAGQRTVSAALPATTQEGERRALLQYGRSIGAPLTAGKILDSKKLQTVESAMNRYPLPGIGQRATQTEAANRNAYQRTALEAAGIEGETAATPNVTDRATNHLSQRFEDLTRDNELKVDHQFGTDIAKAKESFSQQLEAQMPKDITKQLNELHTAADALRPKPTPSPGTPSLDKYPSTDVSVWVAPDRAAPLSENPSVTIDGRTYQNIRSKLSKMLTSTSGTDTLAVGGMIDALDGLAERSLPKETVGDFKDVRRKWRNLMTIKEAVGSAHNPETAVGNIPTARFAKESEGNPDLERLGQYGSKYVGDKIPDSGTAQRHAATGIFGSLAGLHHFGALTTGQAMAAAAGAAAPYGFDLLMNNPATRAAILSRYRNPSQALVPFGALAGQSALQQAR